MLTRKSAQIIGNKNKADLSVTIGSIDKSKRQILLKIGISNRNVARKFHLTATWHSLQPQLSIKMRTDHNPKDVLSHN